MIRSSSLAGVVFRVMLLSRIFRFTPIARIYNPCATYQLSPAPARNEIRRSQSLRVVAGGKIRAVVIGGSLLEFGILNIGI